VDPHRAAIARAAPEVVVAAAVAMAVAAAAEVHLMAPAITEAEATRTTTPPETHVVSMTLTTRSTRSDVKRPLKQATATASPPILQDFTTCFFLRNSNLSDLQVPHEARPSPVAQVFALTIENAGVHKDAKCLFFPFYLDQAPLRWLDSLEKNSIDEWDQLKAQFTSNFVGTMGRSGTRMDLAMVKQEQGETLRQYMWCFFDKSATVVDVTDKKVIDLFKDGLYQRRTFEDFGHHRPSSITKLKDMITSWADEEDKVRPIMTPFAERARTTRATTTTTTTTRIMGVATIITTQVLTASVSQTTQSWLYSTLRRKTPKRPLAASKTCSKRSVRGIWTTTTPLSSATSFGENSWILPTHVLLMTRRARKKSTKETTTSRNPTRQ
jgi:hypothetical protein